MLARQKKLKQQYMPPSNMLINYSPPTLFRNRTLFRMYTYI